MCRATCPPPSPPLLHVPATFPPLTSACWSTTYWTYSYCGFVLLSFVWSSVRCEGSGKSIFSFQALPHYFLTKRIDCRPCSCSCISQCITRRFLFGIFHKYFTSVHFTSIIDNLDSDYFFSSYTNDVSTFRRSVLVDSFVFVLISSSS